MVMCQKDVAKNSEQRYRLEGLEKALHKWQDLNFENVCPAQGTEDGENISTIGKQAMYTWNE